MPLQLFNFPQLCSFSLTINCAKRHESFALGPIFWLILGRKLNELKHLALDDRFNAISDVTGLWAQRWPHLETLSIWRRIYVGLPEVDAVLNFIREHTSLSYLALPLWTAGIPTSTEAIFLPFLSSLHIPYTLLPIIEPREAIMTLIIHRDLVDIDSAVIELASRFSKLRSLDFCAQGRTASPTIAEMSASSEHTNCWVSAVIRDRYIALYNLVQQRFPVLEELTLMLDPYIKRTPFLLVRSYSYYGDETVV